MWERPIQALFVVGGPLCDVGTPSLSLHNFTESHSMKIEWLVGNVTAVRSPDRAERAILKLILAGRSFWPIQAIFVIKESL